jgi:glycosyltransferase involved in cell wall biosynthesis
MNQSVSETSQNRFSTRPPAWAAVEKCKLKVLFISDATASRNGVGSYYADLVDHLAHFIEQAELISPGAKPENYTHKKTLPLPGDPTQRIYLPWAGRVWERVKNVSPHVIVVPTPGPYGLLGLAIACYLKIPLCAGFHTRYEKLTGLYWTAVSRGVSRISIKCLNRLFFLSSVCVVANSREMIQEAQRQGAIHAEMIGTPIARAFLNKSFDIPAYEVNSVCYAGRLAPEKNIRAVLDAARELPHIRFTIAGDGPLRNEVAGTAESTSNIDYVGWVSRREVKTFIDGSEMLILPSREEAFGTIALEAMARRRLVLVSERCGILNWSDLASGVYSIKSTESLADAIQRISKKSFPERLEKTKRAYQAAVSFNRDTVCQWVGLLSDIADNAQQ